MLDRMRISRALAVSGISSRRAADVMVSAGRVTVNGVPAILGQLVDPANDVIAVDDRRIEQRPESVYLLAVKPSGVTSTVADRHAERTIIDLVPASILQRARRLYPVGRLDRDSEGLLLLTNDGDWAARVLHPSHRVQRQYAVGLAAPLQDRNRAVLEDGVALAEGMATLDDLEPLDASGLRAVTNLLGQEVARLTWYRATIHQGWKRQLRRMFVAAGAPVVRLVRLRFGPLGLGGMRLGEVRELTTDERQRLDAAVSGGR